MANKKQRARALVDIDHHNINCKCGRVFEADVDTVKSLVESGLADADESAVAAGLIDYADIVQQDRDDVADIQAATLAIEKSNEALHETVASVGESQ